MPLGRRPRTPKSRCRRALAWGLASMLAMGCASSRVLRATPAGAPDPSRALTAMDSTGSHIRRLLRVGDYPAAESIAAVLAERSNGVPADAALLADALDLELEAAIAGGRFWDPVADRCLARVLALRAQALAADSSGLARTLDLEGRLEQARWNDHAAIDAYERSLSFRRPALAAGDPEAAGTMRRLGLTWLDLPGGSPGTADSLIEGSAALTERRTAPDDPERIASDEALAFLAERRGRASMPLFESVLARTERVFGPEHPLLAERLVNVSERWRGTARNAEAGELMTRAHAIYERRLGARNLLTASACNLIGVNHVWAGHIERARPCFEQSLATIRDLLGPDHPATIKPALDLGDLEWREGDEAAGIPLLEHAVELAERELPKDDPYTALGLRMLGEGYLSAGRLQDARAVLERRLAWDLRYKPAGHPDIGWTMDLLAGAVPDPHRQRELYEGAAHNFLAAYGPDHPRGARGLLLLASYRFADGDHAGAIQLCDSATAVLKRTRGDGSTDVAWSEYTAGWMHLASGRADQAVHCLERSTAAFAGAVGPTSAITAMSLHELGEALIASGDPRRAFETALQAEAIHRGLLRDNTRSMAEAQALTLPGSPFMAHAAGLDLLLSLAAGPLAGDVAARRAAWDALVRSRAVVQETMLERHRRWVDGADPMLESLVARFDSTARRVSKLEVRGPLADPPAEFRSQLDRARAERDHAERDLATHSARLRTVEAHERCGVDSLAAELPAGCALAAYVAFERAERQGGGLARTRCYLAFVLGADGVPAVVPLGPAEPVDSLVARWQEELRRAPWGPTGARAAERRYRDVALKLRRAVWDPVAAHAPNTPRLFLVPDGTLGIVNFATLPVGDSEYLLERGPCLHYLPTERDLALGREPAAVGRGLLAIGAPAFDANPVARGRAEAGLVATDGFRGPRADCATFQGIRFGPLPASADELVAVAGIWRASRAESTGSADAPPAPAVVLTGADASETAFRSRAAGRRVLHLATHGFFVGGECRRPDSDARGIGGMIPNAVAQTTPGETTDELRLSGLALAGANLRASTPPDQDDGILTAEEIAAMDLSGVQWAVLSACDTGLGDYRASEGVMGFRRSFLIAGARTTIMSLWEVRDRSVARWMRTLYESHWQRGHDTADAVREASLAELHRLRAAGLATHPARWGAFIAVGDWR